MKKYFWCPKNEVTFIQKRNLIKVDFVYEKLLPTVLNFMALHMSLRSNESDNMTCKIAFKK